MTKKTKTMLWIFGGVVGALVVGRVAYAEMHKPAVPAGTLPVGSITPASSFTTGLKYTFAASIPSSGMTDVQLKTALESAGWTSVTILYINGTGTTPPGFPPVSTNGYIASGIWQGPNGTAAPTGVVAAATP